MKKYDICWYRNDVGNIVTFIYFGKKHGYHYGLRGLWYSPFNPFNENSYGKVEYHSQIKVKGRLRNSYHGYLFFQPKKSKECLIKNINLRNI